MCIRKFIWVTSKLYTGWSIFIVNLSMLMPKYYLHFKIDLRKDQYMEIELRKGANKPTLLRKIVTANFAFCQRVSQYTTTHFL